MQNEMRDRLVELFYENNVRCDQTIEHLVDDVVSIFEDLINRQQAENKNLKGHLEQLKSRYDNAKAEIERLERHTEMYHELRADAIKELEAKIHEKLHQAEMHGNSEPVVTREMFDSVVKEVVGEQE